MVNQSYRSSTVRDLRLGLGYISVSRRREYLKRLRELIPSLKPNRYYSYQDICYRITRFRPSDERQEKIKGSDLLHDLSLLFSELSGLSNFHTDELDGEFWTEEELCVRFDLSPSHLEDWLSRGLLGWRVKSGDGPLVLYLRHEVWEFLARWFYLLDIVSKAKQLRKKLGIGLSRSCEFLGEQVGESPDSILYSIKLHDYQNPSGAVYPELLDGSRWLGDKFSKLYREALKRRSEALRLLEGLQFFHYSEEFDLPGAEGIIFGGDGSLPDKLPVEVIDSYLGQLKTEPVGVDEEYRRFRAFNYAKWRLNKLILSTPPSAFDSKVLSEVRRLSSIAIELRNSLVESNLRLVANVAIKHIGCGRSADELISDGIVSLFSAVERFDFTRGTKFSTYLTWSLMKNYAKSAIARSRRRESTEEAVEELESRARRGISPKVKEAVREALASLTERERKVISARFGFLPDGECKPLRVIARMLGISHEAVRKIETRALEKLRQVLSTSGEL